MLVRPGEVARYEVVVLESGKIDCEATGQSDTANDYLACCTMFYGAAGKSPDPGRFIADVARQVRVKLGLGASSDEAEKPVKPAPPGESGPSSDGAAIIPAVG